MLTFDIFKIFYRRRFTSLAGTNLIKLTRIFYLCNWFLHLRLKQFVKLPQHWAATRIQADNQRNRRVKPVAYILPLQALKSLLSR
jgi:hypothetical protein